MIIRLIDIKDRVRHFSEVEAVSEHPVLKELQDEGDIYFLAPLHLDFSAVREFDHIRVTGNVESDATFVCSRCLNGFNAHLESSFTIFYKQQMSGQIQDEEVELGEHELASATYTGEEIDLSQEIVDHLLMEMPMKPLCKEECKGLCNSCGIDLNISGCNCSTAVGNPAFASLKNLKL